MYRLRHFLSFCVTLTFLQLFVYSSFASTNSSEGNTSYLTDEANVLTVEQRDELAETLTDHNKNGQDIITVVIIPKLPPKTTIKQYAFKKINDRAFSPRENARRILLILAMEEGQVRIETGDDVWLVLSDQNLQQVIDDIMVPQFNKNQYFFGFRDAVTAIIKKIGESENANQLARDQMTFSYRYGVKFLSFHYQPRVHFIGASLPLISGNAVSERFSGIDAGVFFSGCSIMPYRPDPRLNKYGDREDVFNGISMSGLLSTARSFNGFSITGFSYYDELRGMSLNWLGAFTKRTYGVSFGTVLSGSLDFQGVSTSLIFAGADYFQGFSIAGVSFAEEELKGISIGALFSGAKYLEGLSIAGMSYAGEEFKGISVNWFAAWAKKSSGLTFGTIFSGGSEFQGVSASLIFSLSKDFEGLSIAPIISGGDNFQGVSAAFIISGADYFEGLSVGGVNWGTEKFTGGQIGIFNYAKKLNGVQIGLINIARDALIPYTIGLNLNFKNKTTEPN
ncbi:MAG: TPM domain-containing protein [Deltaproteobacteria bacterium]|nr:TPM domain-containing protein [Deltaproteobacteria bacterium]